MPEAISRIPALAARWRDGAISDAEFAVLYFLHFQYGVFGARFASRARRDVDKPQGAMWLNWLTSAQATRQDFITYFESYHFLHVIPNVNRAFVHWLRGEWRIELFDRIPTPLEVLELQVRGIRPATVICDYPRMTQPVLTKRHGLHFLTHDLEHAYKFFSDLESHAMQRELFTVLQNSLECGEFAPYLCDPRFQEQFDYLISDMNTHTLHSLQYLRAILIEQVLRAAGRGPRERIPASRHEELNCLLHRLATACRVPWDGLRVYEQCA